MTLSTFVMLEDFWEYRWIHRGAGLTIIQIFCVPMKKFDRNL